MSEYHKNLFDIMDQERYNQKLNISLSDINSSLKELSKNFGIVKEDAKSFEHVLTNTAMWKSLYENILARIELNKQLSEEALATEKKLSEEYLSEAEKYEVKRTLITQKYIAERAKPENAHPIKQQGLTLNEQEEFQALNIATLKKSDLWTNLFIHIDKLSKKSIKSQIADLESLLKYIKTNRAEGAIPTGYAPEEVEYVNKIAKGYAEGSDAAKKYVEEQENALKTTKKSFSEFVSKSHISRIIEGFNSLGKSAAGTKEEIDAVGNILEGFTGVGAAFTQVGKAMDEAGMKAGKVVVTIGNVISQTASMAGAGASVGGPWGAIVGAVVGLGSSLVPALQTTSELSESTKNYYESLIKLADELINKQVELIKVSSGSAVSVAANSAKTWLEFQAEQQDEYIEKYLNKSGSNSRSERHNVTQKLKDFFADNSNFKEFQAELKNGGYEAYSDIFPEYEYYKNANWKAKSFHQNDLGNLFDLGYLKLESSDLFNVEELEKAGINVVKLLTDVTGSVKDLDATQIQVLKENAPKLWGLFDEETQKFLDGVIEREKKLKEIETARRESYTGTTFAELLKSLDTIVQKADDIFDDISTSFTGHMSKAILNMVKKKYLTDQLETWYGNFADKMDDDQLTESEIEELKKEYTKIVEGANEAYKTAMGIAGLEIPKTAENADSSQTRTATAQGIASMSQDTASELNGNFYALFMTVDNIHQSMEKWQEQEDSKREYTLPTLKEMLDVSKSSNTYLLDIRNNTSHLIAIDSNIEFMNNNILALRNDGVKIRS